MSKHNSHEEHCAFCGRPATQVDMLIHGTDACICSDCAERAKENRRQQHAHRAGREYRSRFRRTAQTQGNQSLSRPVHHRAGRCQKIPRRSGLQPLQASAQPQRRGGDDNVEIEKSNIVMVGSTGTGKTLLARTIAKLLKSALHHCRRHGLHPSRLCRRRRGKHPQPSAASGRLRCGSRRARYRLHRRN